MRRYSLTYFLSTGIKSFFRNSFMSFAAIVILVSALLICGTFVLLLFNIDYNINQIDDFNEVAVFAALSSTDEQIAEIEAQINALPQVESCELIPKEESIKKERERYGEEHSHLFERYLLYYLLLLVLFLLLQILFFQEVQFQLFLHYKN